MQVIILTTRRVPHPILDNNLVVNGKKAIPAKIHCLVFSPIQILQTILKMALF